jgi:hypothetical protein
MKQIDAVHPDRVNLTEEELLLTPVAIHGFSLSDNVWCEHTIICIIFDLRTDFPM